MRVKTKTVTTADEAVGLIRANFCVSRPDVFHTVRQRAADKAIAAIRADERAKVLAEQAALLDQTKVLLEIIATHAHNSYKLEDGCRVCVFHEEEIATAREMLAAAAQMRACGAHFSTPEAIKANDEEGNE